jgi:hypothetical protein
MLNLFFDFGDFRITFIYKDALMRFNSIAEGAVVTDRKGNLLAEGRLSDTLATKGNQFTGVEVEEFHYDKSSKVKFRCKSEFDFPMGFKQKEKSKSGKKENEYFFLWSVRNF